MKFFNKDALVMLEAPWLKKQIETHLFFGFCARTLPFAFLFLASCTFALLYSVFSAGFGLRLDETIEYLFGIFVGISLLKLPKYHQAAIGWCVIKFTVSLFCFVCMVAGGLVGFFKGNQMQFI